MSLDDNRMNFYSFFKGAGLAQILFRVSRLIRGRL